MVQCYHFSEKLVFPPIASGSSAALSQQNLYILSDWQSHSSSNMHDETPVLTASMHAPSCFFSYSDEETASELDKKQKLTEKPDLNDVMNIVAAKIPGKWEMVSASINTVMYM